MRDGNEQGVDGSRPELTLAPTSPDTEASDAAAGTRAVISMLVAMACLVVNDTLVKLASDHLPTGQIIAIRGLFASVAVLGLALATGALVHLPKVRDRGIFLRTAGEVIATMFFLTALVQMPIADITAIMQVAPLVVTAGSAIFLREAVGWRRWVAAIVGFAGVLLIVQPGGSAFNWAALYGLAAVLFVSLRDLATRTVRRDIPTVLVTGIAAVAVTALGFAMGPFEVWQAPDVRDFSLLAAAAAFLVIAYAAVISATRNAPAALVAPYRYSLVIWALLSGWLIWGDLPNALASLGIVIVVGAGLYTFWRERRRGGVAKDWAIARG